MFLPWGGKKKKSTGLKNPAARGFWLPSLPAQAPSTDDFFSAWPRTRGLISNVVGNAPKTVFSGGRGGESKKIKRGAGTEGGPEKESKTGNWPPLVKKKGRRGRRFGGGTYNASTVPGAVFIFSFSHGKIEFEEWRGGTSMKKQTLLKALHVDGGGAGPVLGRALAKITETVGGRRMRGGAPGDFCFRGRRVSTGWFSKPAPAVNKK